MIRAIDSRRTERRKLFPEKLYGRDASKESLRVLFDDVCAGGCKLALVPGRSGVGKTALVESLRTTVEERGGVFIAGKFDQYSHSTPYAAFRQALNDLSHFFLEESLSSQNETRELLLRSLGPLSGLITQFVPSFETFLGKQPKLQDINSGEAVHRFLNAFSQLFKAICRPSQPLVLFLDDWQWSDSASCVLLKDMLLNQNNKYLLIIAAYRDDEVDSFHAFSQILKDISKSAQQISSIAVGDLSLRELHDFVVDSFCNIENLPALIDLVFEKTGGNPIFVRELLAYLCGAGYICRDHDQKWVFEVDRAKGEGDIPNSIVDLYSLKISSQRASLKEMIATAACLGSKFDLELLSVATKRPVADLKDDLDLSLSLGLVSKDLSRKSSESNTCRFLHDRIQQAAHRLIGKSSLPETHLRIGRLMLNVLSGDALDQNLFEVTYHMNQGAGLIDSIDEKIRLIELNVNAARKARQSVAYSSMRENHCAAVSLVDEKVSRVLWEDHNALGLALYKERAESEFLEGDKSEAVQSLLFAEQKAATVLEKAEILNDLIVLYTLMANYADAIRTARNALALLGHSFPEDDFEAVRDAEIDHIRGFLQRQRPDYLVSLPVMTDPEVRMATKIMITMGPPCYRSHQKLWGVIVAKVVSLVIEHGNIPQVGYSHTAFAGLLIWVRNDFALARNFGEAAIQIMNETFADPSAQSVFHLMVGSSYRHWFYPLHQSSEDYLRAYDVGVQSGNLQYAAYGFGHNMYCSFFQGVSLEELVADTKRSLEFSQSRLNWWAIDLFRGGLSLFSRLTEAQPDSGTGCDPEDNYLKEIKARNNIQVRCFYHVMKAFVHLVLNEHESALSESDRAGEIIYTVGTQGLAAWPEHVFTRFLILAALFQRADGQQQVQWRSELESSLEKLGLWAEHCPANYQHKFSLAKAEMARVDGRHDEAARCYAEAARNAQQHGFTQWQAIANERAWEFYEACGLSRPGMFCWQEAYINFKRWGAPEKVRRMKDRFADLVEQEGRAQAVNYSAAVMRSFSERVFDYVDHHLMVEMREGLRIETDNRNSELTRALESLQKEISNRKRSERQAYLNELRMQLAIDSAKMGVWSYDLVENRRHFDETTCELLGINPDSFSGRAEEFFAAVHPEDHEIVRQGIKTAVDAGVPYGVEYRAVRGNGEIVYLKNYGKVVYDEFGNPERLHGILMDISSQVHHARERDMLIQSLKEKTEQQERFAYTVSHDLKTPLVTFDGFLGFLERDCQAGNFDNFDQYLGFMKDSTTRMKLLIDDLLHLSKVGLKPHEPICCNLLEIIQDAILNAEGYVKKTGAALIVQKNMPVVLVDRQGFLQVFENLITNAIKFSEGAEKPTIEIGIKHLSNEQVCYVKDNGIGIEDSNKERVFQIFEKLDKNTEGTGVGLSIVKQILDAHKCRIWVESEGPGSGTTFNIELTPVLKNDTSA